MTAAAPVAPRLLRAGHPHRRWVLAVTSLGLLVVILGNSVLTVSLPTMAADLGADHARMQWFLDAYLLVFASLLLVAGSWGDRHGRRLAFVVGLVILAGGSTVAALLGSADAVIGGRAVMGLGAALVMPSTLALVNAVFPPEEKPAAMAVWTIVAGLGIAAGPSVGGWLLGYAGWQAVFWVNVPVALVAIVAAVVVVPEARAPERRPLDLPGAVLSVVTAGLVVHAVIAWPHHGGAAPAVWVPLAAGLLTGSVLLGWEVRAPYPMLPMVMLGDARFSAAGGAAALGNFALMGLVLFYTVYMQLGLDYSAVETGLLIIPSAVAIMTFSVLGARVHVRRGPRLPVTLGLAAISASLLTLSQVGSGAGYPLVLSAQLLLGAGIGLSGPASTASMMSAMPPDRAGVASAVNDTARELGALLGVAVLGAVMAAGYTAAMSEGVPEDGLTQGTRRLALTSAAGARLAAASLPGPASDRLVDRTVAALEQGIAAGSLVGAVVAALGALVAARFLRGTGSARSAD